MDAVRRRDLIESLVVVEVEELAFGRRHLTIAHGSPADAVESALLDDLYDAVMAIAGRAEWSRVRGTSEFVTITLADAGADELLADVADLAHRANPGSWHVSFVEPSQLALGEYLTDHWLPSRSAEVRLPGGPLARR